MDRRQRKTRTAIFNALVELLSKKDFALITVGEIIERADVGRATFYSHFETKDFLLKELCKELFHHIFNSAVDKDCDHKSIFECDAPDSVFLHLLRHLQNNDNRILELISCKSNEIFLSYFKSSLRRLVIDQSALFEARKSPKLPDELWTEHIVSTFVETVRWWAANGMKESPEVIAEYFYLSV